MKKLKFLVGAVALFAVVAVNVWNATTVTNASALNIGDVENVADGFEWSDIFGGSGYNLNFWSYQYSDNYQYVTTTFRYEDNSVRESVTQLSDAHYLCVPDGSDNCTVGQPRVEHRVRYYFNECDRHDGEVECHQYDPNRPYKKSY